MIRRLLLLFVAVASLGSAGYAAEHLDARTSTHVPRTTINIRICAGRPKPGLCGPRPAEAARPRYGRSANGWEQAGSVTASLRSLGCPPRPRGAGRCAGGAASGATIVFKATPNARTARHEFARWADACAHARKDETCRLRIEGRPPHRTVVTAVFRLRY